MPNPTIHVEETGRTREKAARLSIPGCATHQVFASGPIRRYFETKFPSQGPERWPIYDWLMLADGRWFDFHRPAVFDEKGVVDLEQVNMGNEIVISPGLIYRVGTVQLPQLHRWRAAQDKLSSMVRNDDDTNITISTTNNGLDTRL